MLRITSSHFIVVLAIASLGWACEPSSDADTQGKEVNVPSTVMLCGHEWTTRNLDVATYRNGDPIPQVKDPGEWVKLTTGAWCW
ncbi:MAG: hypothetical protein ACK46C_03975, partial [Flavobacteriales bacterium]